MQLLKIKQANYISDYKLDVLFNNGYSASIDFRYTIFSDKREIFRRLEDINYFRSFTQNRWTIEWDNGLDFAPEFLLDLAEKQYETISTSI